MASLVTFIPAIIIITGMAFLPGGIAAFVVISLILAKEGISAPDNLLDEDISVLIACRNEEDCIFETIESIATQEYTGDITVFAIDNASTDSTRKEMMRAKLSFPNIRTVILSQPIKGKHNALNLALEKVVTRYVITVDGDTILAPNSLRDIVYFISKSKKYVSVAGWIMERNKRVNFITKMQTYDYCLSIGAVKKVQGVYDSTLVTQGAFSIYKTQAVKDVEGWPDTIGEDIVLTWNLLKKGHLTGFCENAIAYTNVPETVKMLFKQRSRWARGMIEGLKRHNPLSFKQPQTAYFTGINMLMPYIDFSYIFFFIPGVILAFFGYYVLAGILTLVLLPLVVIEFLIMYINLPKGDTHRTVKGLIGFILIYQAMMSAMSLYGYFEEARKSARDWK